MSQEPQNSPEETALQFQSDSGLAKLPSSGSSALTEIIGQSLIHIQTSRVQTTLHRIGKRELYWPDYQLVCIWAEELRLTPVEVLEHLLHKPDYTMGDSTTIVNGRFKCLFVDGRVLPIKEIPVIEGLRIEKLRLADPYNYASVLECGQGPMINLNLSAVPQLTELFCGNLQLIELDLSPVPNLTHLDCGGNSLMTLEIATVPKLHVLICHWNELSKLDLSALTNLKELYCSNNHLKALDVTTPQNLEKLDCSSNQIANLDLSMTPSLTSLCCSDNFLNRLDLSANMELRLLACDENPIVELDICSIKELRIFSHPEENFRILQRPDQNFR